MPLSIKFMTLNSPRFGARVEAVHCRIAAQSRRDSLQFGSWLSKASTPIVSHEVCGLPRDRAKNGARGARENQLQTMKPWTRRSVLAGFVTLAAQPAHGQRRAQPSREAPKPSELDAIIVGAGAAGIAAARRLSAAGRSFTVIEASAR